MKIKMEKYADIKRKCHKKKCYSVSQWWCSDECYRSFSKYLSVVSVIPSFVCSSSHCLRFLGDNDLLYQNRNSFFFFFLYLSICFPPKRSLLPWDPSSFLGRPPRSLWGPPSSHWDAPSSVRGPPKPPLRPLKLFSCYGPFSSLQGGPRSLSQEKRAMYI